MTASFSPATWLPAALARRAVVPAEPVDPEWRREQFDRQRDDDPFEWLGFAPEPDGEPA
jgi:hypothetical protein